MDILASVLVPVLIDAIAVLGLYVISASGRLSAGHAVFFGIGGYASGLVSTRLGLPPVVSLIAGIVLAAVVAVVFSLISDRLSHWFFAVATLAFLTMMISLVSGLDALGGATGLYGIPLAVGLKATVVALVLAIGVVIVFDRSRIGRAVRAIRDSELAAQSLAINPTAVRAFAFALGAGFAGLAGGLWSHSIGLIKPADMSIERSLLYLIFLYIGGADLWVGALFGTFLLSLLPELLRFSGAYRLVMFGGLLTVVMILHPAGLITRLELDRLKALIRPAAAARAREVG